MSNMRAIGDSDAITAGAALGATPIGRVRIRAQLELVRDRRRIVEVLGAHAHLVRRIQEIADHERDTNAMAQMVAKRRSAFTCP